MSFYWGKIKSNVFVYLELLASIQDQLEQRKFNCIILGVANILHGGGFETCFESDSIM